LRKRAAAGDARGEKERRRKQGHDSSNGRISFESRTSRCADRVTRCFSFFFFLLSDGSSKLSLGLTRWIASMGNNA
jgi:hypothetical protein